MGQTIGRIHTYDQATHWTLITSPVIRAHKKEK